MEEKESLGVGMEDVRCDTHNPENGRCSTITWVEIKSYVKKMIKRIKKFFTSSGFDHFCEG